MRDIIWVIVFIYLIYEVISLKKNLKQLTQQFNKFKDDYRYLIKSGAIKLPTVDADLETKAVPQHITDPIAIQSEIIPASTVYENNSTQKEFGSVEERDMYLQERENDLAVETPQAEVVPVGPSYLDNFVEWFKVDWPMKIGGLVFILGVGWFLIFAIQNNWISPAMRIALGIIVSLAMIGFGRTKLRSQPIQGSYLVGLGSAVYVLSIFIGYKFFAFFGISLGLALIGVQYALMAYLSYHYRNHGLNDVGLFFSMICPFIFSDGSGNYLGLFSYLTIHILGNMAVSYIYNWDKSRMMGLLYVCGYIALGLLASADALGAGSLVTLILVLLMAITLLEVWMGRNSSSGFSSTQLGTIALAGVSIISYITILRYIPNTSVNEMIYTSVCLYFAVGYIALWYLYSIRNPQNSYSVIVGILALVFISAVAYEQLSGVSLLLASIILTGVIQAFVTIVTKDADTIKALSIGWIIPLILLVYNYNIDGVSNGYLVALYSSVVVGGGLAALYRYYLPDQSGLRTTTIGLSIVMFYVAICHSFDGTSRIVVLEAISLIIALIGSHLHLSRTLYLQAGIVSVVLPAIYVLYHGLYQDITLFGLMIGLVAIVGVYSQMQSSLIDTDHRESDYQTLVMIGLVILYLAGPYLIQSDYYTLTYTILGMMVYLVGTKYRNPLGLDKLGYSGILIIPILLSVGLLDMPNTSLVVLTTILLSASIIRVIEDSRRNEHMTGMILYTYVLMSLVYFWWFGYVATRSLSSSESAIVVMLIVFTIIGIICYVRGKSNDSKDLRTIGTVIIIAMIARVLVVELWLMVLVEKIITCLVIGGLLVASGFIGNNNDHSNDDPVK